MVFRESDVGTSGGGSPQTPNFIEETLWDGVIVVKPARDGAVDIHGSPE